MFGDIFPNPHFIRFSDALFAEENQETLQQLKTYGEWRPILDAWCKLPVLDDYGLRVLRDEGREFQPITGFEATEYFLLCVFDEDADEGENLA